MSWAAGLFTYFVLGLTYVAACSRFGAEPAAEATPDVLACSSFVCAAAWPLCVLVDLCLFAHRFGKIRRERAQRERGR